MNSKSNLGPWSSETVVAAPGWVYVLVWILFPLLGAGAGWLLKSAAGWVASLPWAPFQGPLKLVASIPEPQATIATLVIGAVAGLVLAFLAAMDRLTVTVSDDQVTMARGESTREIKRASIGAVFLDGKYLVLLGQASDELAREACDLNANQLRDAFLAHGCPWQADGDPYKDQYWRWVEDTPDLDASANALLKARARALEKGDDDDAAELRAELAKLGIVVRDEKKRQYWRRTKRYREVPSSTLDS